MLHHVMLIVYALCKIHYDGGGRDPLLVYWNEFSRRELYLCITGKSEQKKTLIYPQTVILLCNCCSKAPAIMLLILLRFVACTYVRRVRFSAPKYSRVVAAAVPLPQQTSTCPYPLPIVNFARIVLFKLRVNVYLKLPLISRRWKREVVRRWCILAEILGLINRDSGYVRARRYE